MNKKVAYAVNTASAPDSRKVDIHFIGMCRLSLWGRLREASGYAMAGLLVLLGVMGVLSLILLPVWNQTAKREREAELIFRGEQYARAVELYQRRYVGANPSDFETLVERRFLRKLYADPVTDEGEFRVIYFSQIADIRGVPATGDRPGESLGDNGAGARSIEPSRFGDDRSGGVVGVVSLSDEASLRIYNNQEQYDEWFFVYAPSATEPGTGVLDTGIRPSRRGSGRAGSEAEASLFRPGRGGDGIRGPDRARGSRDVETSGLVDR